MALSDMAVFSEYLYRTMTELGAQEIEKFNAASDGTIVLSPGNNQGDYSDKTLYQYLSGIVRRRNAYGTGSVSSKKLAQLIDTMVKVAAGTAPIEWTKSQYSWIQQNEAEHGVVLGRQMAEQMVADMLGTALMAGYAAMSQDSDIVYDGTAGTMTPTAMLNGTRIFGDRSSAIRAWVMHSKPLFDMFATNLANASNLFNYGTVRILGDIFGNRFVITDATQLVTTGSPDTYHSLGLVEAAIVVQQNNDFADATVDVVGQENLAVQYQAEWTYNLGVKGHSWDKSNGGHSPNDTALGTATNWDAYATSIKDGPGVIVNTQ
jgi:hypothetical protein